MNSELKSSSTHPIDVLEEDLEEVAKLILHINELKQELGRLVTELTMQARKGIDSEEDSGVGQ